MCRVAETLDGMPCFVQKRLRRTSCPSKLPRLCPAVRERHGASRRRVIILRQTDWKSVVRSAVHVLRQSLTMPQAAKINPDTGQV